MNSVETTSAYSALNAAALPATVRSTDLASLHPIMRDAAAVLARAFEAEGLPFRIFEAFRSPFRQDWLYQQGRSRPGSIVTYAQPWDSYHQYGLAADFVLCINGVWTWSSLGINTARWERLHALGETVGLEPLRFEAPHLQVAGLNIDDLRAGKFPGGGDDAWRDTLEGAVISWNGKSSAPPIESLRPALSGDTKLEG
jgi:peptidoglycan L-alanyl-D-glutamate endopeptidase CwlK